MHVSKYYHTGMPRCIPYRVPSASTSNSIPRWPAAHSTFVYSETMYLRPRMELILGARCMCFVLIDIGAGPGLYALSFVQYTTVVVTYGGMHPSLDRQTDRRVPKCLHSGAERCGIISAESASRPQDQMPLDSARTGP